MNTTKLVSLLLGVAALVVLVVVLALFFQKKGDTASQESKPSEGDSKTSSETPTSEAATGVLNVVTYLRDSKVDELRTLAGSYLLDARAKGSYQSVGQTVTVVLSDLEDAPGYTKSTHTLSAPFKGTEVVFDNVSKLPTFENPVAELTAYWFDTTLLFLTFKTVSQAGQTAQTKFYHFSANRTEEGLRWSKLELDHTNQLDLTVLAAKLDEVNALFGNVVALHLDEFLEAAAGTYSSEFGGVVSSFSLTKRPFTQAGFVKVVHKLVLVGSDSGKPFKLKKVLVSGTGLTDLSLPKKPVSSVSVYWWYNTPLLAELDLVGGSKEYFVYNLDANNWQNQPVDKVRTTLTLLKNSLGVPLTLDLGKKGAATAAGVSSDVTYTTNEVLVRVSGPAPDSPHGFPKYTHRFVSGKSYFVGSFHNSGTPQNGLPFARVNEVSVFFSEDVPLLVLVSMSGSGSLSTKQAFYSNNGFGFWSRVMLTETLKDTDAVLKKLDAENKKLVSANDKYVVDVVMKSDYLSVGKLLRVTSQNVPTELKGYSLYQHNKKDNSVFKFEKLVKVGRDVPVEGLEQLTGVSLAKVYMFLNTPLLVHLSGTMTVPVSQSTPVQPVPNPSQLPAAPQAGGVGVPGVAGVGGVSQPGVGSALPGQPGVGVTQVPGSSGQGPTTGQGVSGPTDTVVGQADSSVQSPASRSPVAAATTTKPFNHYYSFNGELKKWTRVEYAEVGDGQTNRLKTVLDKAKATLGYATLQVGHGVGTYSTGPVTVTVTNTTSKSKYASGVFDMMLHEMSAPFVLGKLKHFDFDLNMTHVPLKQNQKVADEPSTQNPPQPYKLDFPVQGMEVYVYKYVPLLVVLLMEEGSNLLFTNTLADSTWLRFTFDGDAVTKVSEKLEELRKKLTSVSSLDVCKQHNADEAGSYKLETAVGEGSTQVTISRLQDAPDGMNGVVHTLPTAQKLGSLNCGQEVLTGLNLDSVSKVSVYFKGAVPAVVRANSTPKYFTLNAAGGLSRHVLPADATDLSSAQLTDLVTTVTNNMGSVLEFNLDLKTDYNVSSSSLYMKVTGKTLGQSWSLYTHTLGENNEQFTVSKFMKGVSDVVGMPLNKTLTSVYVGYKETEPKLLGLKTFGTVRYEWYVYDKYRWLHDFYTDSPLEDEEVVAVLEDVDDGLENEFHLNLALELTHESFDFDHHVYAEPLTGFARNTYTVTDLRYPFLLGALQYNSDALTVKDLATHHLNSFTSYTLLGEPVFFHALTYDKKSLFYETDFSHVFSLVNMGEFNEETLKTRLLALKTKAASLVSVELTATEGYKSYHTDVNVKELTDAGLAGFKKWEHKLPETPVTGAAAKPTAFTFNKVKYNGTPLNLTLHSGTVTSVSTFLAEDVPVAFYFLLTPPPAAPQQTSSGPVASGPPPGVVHHYYFHNAGNWEPSSPANALTNEELKKKLDEALTSLGRRLTVNLANKVTHSPWKKVYNADETEVTDTAVVAAEGQNTRTTKTLDFLVEASAKEVGRLRAYAHVPQLKVVKGTGDPTPEELSPFVAHFTFGKVKLRGFEFSKVDKFTVYWVDDTYPVFVHVKTPTAHKFYRYATEDKWVMVKALEEFPSDSEMFEMASFARDGFSYEASVELGADTGLGTSYKYASGQLTMRVVDSGMLGTNHKVFAHTSTSVFAPSFVLDDLNMYGELAYRPTRGLGYAHEVRVFTNVDKFPLLVEVATTKFKHPKAPLTYHYFKFDQTLGGGNGLPLVFVKDTNEKLSETALLELLKPLNAVKDTTFLVDLSAKEAYNAKTGVTFTVARTAQAGTGNDQKFDVYDHTFAGTSVKKTLVLLDRGKKVGFVTKEAGFTSVTVHWLNGVPVHAALKFGTNQQLNYFFLGGDHWVTTLSFEAGFDYTNKQKLYEKLAPLYEAKHLDFGNKTFKTQFGKYTDLKLVDHEPQGLVLPDGLVGYKFDLVDPQGYNVVKMLNFGLDFDALELELVSGNLKAVHVFSPESFYAPLFVELVTSVLVAAAVTTEPQKPAEHKEVYSYFHVTTNGFWTGLHTDGVKLQDSTLALRLAKVAFPSPVMVDLGKREGSYGMTKLVVQKSFFDTAHTYARYDHKLANGEKFLVSRWVFGGLSMEGLPVLKADYVSAYFYEDAVPLLLEVGNSGYVKFFSPDSDGRWMPENVSRTAVSAFLDNLVHEMSLVARHSDEWVPHLNTKFLREVELVPEPKPAVVPEPSKDSAKPGTSGTESTAPGTPVPGSPPSETVGPLSKGPYGELAAGGGAGASSGGVQGPGAVGQPQTLPGSPGVVGQPSVPAPTPGQPGNVSPGATQEPAPPGAPAQQQPQVVTAVKKVKRQFKPVLFQYEDLFHGYLTLGKFVKVARFDTVPTGYNFGKHSFVKGGKYFANKFLLGGVEHSFPQAHVSSQNKDKLSNSLGFYSWAENPLMLKLGFDNKTPVFFSYNKTGNTWAPHTVVNLDEELEHLNNLNDVYVFDLAKGHGRQKYYNDKSYYVSDGPQLLPELFKSAEFETFKSVPTAGETQGERYEKVQFKLGKLRLNGVDYPSEGLPEDKLFYFLHVFTSKTSKKPLLLVFYDDQDEGDRRKFEQNNPGKFLGHYYQWNADGTWSRFYPEGVDAVTNKLKELEVTFAVPLTLDLAKLTGAGGFLSYKANGNDFVVERVFVPVVKVAPPPVSRDEESALGRPSPVGEQGGERDTGEPVLTPPPPPAHFPTGEQGGVPEAARPATSPGVGPEGFITLPLVHSVDPSASSSALPADSPGTFPSGEQGGVRDTPEPVFTSAQSTPSFPTGGQGGVLDNHPRTTTVTPTLDTQAPMAAPTVPQRPSEGSVSPYVNPGNQGGVPDDDTSENSLKPGEVRGGAEVSPSTTQNNPQTGTGTNPSLQGSLVTTSSTGQVTTVQPGQNVAGGPVAGQTLQTVPGQPSPPGGPGTTTGLPGTTAATGPGTPGQQPAGATPQAETLSDSRPLDDPEAPVKPVVPDGSQLLLLPTVERLEEGVAYVDVAFVKHSGPVPPTEASEGFELYHHHTPFFVHSFTQEGKTEVTKVVKAKKFNLKKVTYGGVDLDFNAPFEPLQGGYAGLTVFYEKNMKTPFAFALFNLKNNETDSDNVHYDVWVHKNMKWVKTEELDEFYKLMRALELKNDLGPLSELTTKFSLKLWELASATRAMLPNPFSLDLNQDDSVKSGSVVVDKDADLVDGLNMLKQEFKPRLLNPPAGWVDFSLDSVSLHGSRYVGLKLPMVGVYAVYTYFRNSPDRYARFPAVMKVVQKLRRHNKPYFNHWYYLYEGGNEWRFHFHTEDELDDHDLFDLLNSRLYEYHRVSELDKGALLLDLDTKFSHVSKGRFVDSVEFFHDPASTNSPVPEGFLLYRHSMTTENTTFRLPLLKFQGELRETGFKHPFVQYFLYFKVGYVEPFVVVLAQKDNVTEQPTHHWYYVKGHDLVKFTFTGPNDVDPDDHRNRDVVVAKFKELVATPPTPLTEPDALKTDPVQGTKMPEFPATDPTVMSKPVNGVKVVAQQVPAAAPQAPGVARSPGSGVVPGVGVPVPPADPASRGPTDSTQESQRTEATRTETGGGDTARPGTSGSASYDLYGSHSTGESWI